MEKENVLPRQIIKFNHKFTRNLPDKQKTINLPDQREGWTDLTNTAERPLSRLIYKKRSLKTKWTKLLESIYVNDKCARSIKP